MMKELSYEQYKALKIMRDTPDKECSVIAKEADCSWEEIYALADMGLIDMGVERLKQKQVHPVITDAGLSIANKDECNL